MKEERDEKNNKTETRAKEGVWANGGDGGRDWDGFERRERERGRKHTDRKGRK